MKACLAIDLGTDTGYAYNRGAGVIAGTKTLATAKEIAVWGKQRLTRRNDPRVDRLCEWLTDLGQFDVVIFEDVTFSTTTYQTQLWSALRSAVWLCATGGIFECVPVGTLKKFATGNGHADKAAMSAALKKFHPDIWDGSYDDNGIDALWLWQYAQEKFKL